MIILREYLNRNGVYGSLRGSKTNGERLSKALPTSFRLKGENSDWV